MTVFINPDYTAAIDGQLRGEFLTVGSVMHGNGTLAVGTILHGSGHPPIRIVYQVEMSRAFGWGSCGVYQVEEVIGKEP